MIGFPTPETVAPLGVNNDRGCRIAFETQQGGRLMKSKTQRSVFIACLLVVSLGVAAATAAAQGNSPRTKPVAGTFEAGPVNVMARTCLGEDGAYVELRGKWAGTITSPDDARLTGTLEFMAEPALVNLSTGFGTFQGPFSISDPATGMQTARGEFHTVVTEASKNHGFAIGKVMSQGGGPSEDFSANFKSIVSLATLLTTGQFGGVDDARTPAVIQSGHCSGPFKKFGP